MCSVSYHLNMTPGKTFILSDCGSGSTGSVYFPWIRIRIVSLDPDPYRFAWIRIRIKIIRIRNTGFYQCCGSGSKLDPNLEILWIWIRVPNTDPDPHNFKKAKSLDWLSKYATSELFSYAIKFCTLLLKKNLQNINCV